VNAAALSRAIAAAIDARTRLRRRPVGETIAALVQAGERWAQNDELMERLAAASGLHPSMLREVLPSVAAMLDRDAMTALLEREAGDVASAPEWIACVVASNVPALAVPAIALACLAGSAVVVKSGHRDALSGPAFQEALAAVDPALAATVVPVTWPHDPGLDDVLLDAPLAVLTGRDATVAALAARATGLVLGHGTRYGALLLDGGAPLDLAAAARDITLYEQRGCLSPHVAYVTGDASAVADGLAEALATLAETLPPAPATVEDRARVRSFLDDAAWAGAQVRAGTWGAVVLESGTAFRPTCGARTIRVVALPDPAALAPLLPAHAIECVGTNAPLPPGLRARGVARVCPVGRMQRPPLSWPRGQRPALGSLLGAGQAAVMAIER
jgi:acyl-CoA reductase-like NAD-dependent aldehyde dehydrogenase